MRYIGCKDALLPFIDQVLKMKEALGSVLCDIFTGTTSVAKHYKRRGLGVITNDIMAFSYVFQRAYITNNSYPTFRRLLPIMESDYQAPYGYQFRIEPKKRPLETVISYLNELPGLKGFIYHNYSPEGTADSKHQRMYFSEANAKKIDRIRTTLAEWRSQQLVTEHEFYLLLASLLEAVPSVSNISGTYGAFLKSWDPRAQKPLKLEVPEVIESTLHHEAHQQDANALIGQLSCDVLYLDPPYNARQYATNYHILETIACWDNPKIYGKTGLRPYAHQKSAYCDKAKAIPALADLVQSARSKHILLSYNSEGIIPQEQIIRILSTRGKVDIFWQSYRRFKSDSNHQHRTYPPRDTVEETIYYVKVSR